MSYKIEWKVGLFKRDESDKKFKFVRFVTDGVKKEEGLSDLCWYHHERLAPFTSFHLIRIMNGNTFDMTNDGIHFYNIKIINDS